MATWLALAALVVAYVSHDVFGLGGSGADELFDSWVNNALLWAAAAVCLAGALRTPRGRVAWVLAALALACWAIGDTIWAIRFAGSTTDPTVTVSDIFWLAWYPLIVASLALLVRDRVPKFELHRWIDGVVVMLVVATPWVALFLQPVADESRRTRSRRRSSSPIRSATWFSSGRRSASARCSAGGPDACGSCSVSGWR